MRLSSVIQSRLNSYSFYVPHSNSERVSSKHLKRRTEDLPDSISVGLVLAYALIWLDFFDPAASPLSTLKWLATNTKKNKNNSCPRHIFKIAGFPMIGPRSISEQYRPETVSSALFIGDSCSLAFSQCFQCLELLWRAEVKVNRPQRGRL